MADLFEIGIKVDMKQLQAANKELDKLGASLSKTTGATARATKATQQDTVAKKNNAAATKNAAAANQFASRKINEVGMGIQQAGYQMGDFLVQVQSGTNAMVAFGQQATQLVGILPMFAARLNMPVNTLIKLSAGLGIAIPLATALGAAFMRTREESEDASDGVETLESRLKTLTRSLYDFSRAKEAAESGLTLDQILASRAVGGVSQVQNQIRELIKARSALTTSVTGGQPQPIQTAPGFENIGFGGTRRGAFNLPESAEAALAQQRAEEERARITKEIGQLEASLVPIKLLNQKITEEGVASDYERRRETQSRVALLEAEIIYGKDSVQLKEMQERLDKESFAREVSQLDITDKRKLQLIEMFAAVQKINSELEAYSSTMETLSAQAEMFANGFLETKEHTEGARAKAEKYVEAVEKLENKIGEAATDMAIMEGLDIAAGINAAAEAALVLADKLGISFRLASGLVALAGKSREQNLFETKVRTGVLPPQAAGDFGIRGGATPFNLQQYMSDVDRRVKAREEALKKSRGGGGADKMTESEFLRSIQEELEVKRRLAKVNGQEREVLEQVIQLQEKARGQNLLISEERLRQFAEEEMRIKRQMDMQQQFETIIENTLMSVVDGTQSIEDAFRTMLRNILLAIYQQKVAEPFAESIGNFLTNLIPSANGNAFSNGNVVPFANGGVVGGPTFFPMRGNQTGLMGEAGPEAIMPLKRTKGGKLGVVAEGGSSEVNITQVININGNGDQFIERKIAEAAPALARMSVDEVMRARRRGGAMKAAFG